MDKIGMAKIPNLKLRPENADALYVQWAKGDQRKYDFDAAHVEQPEYKFKAPLSSQVVNLNLKDLSRTDKNWREIVSVRPVDAIESKLISRMIEFERLQRKTVDVERERRLKGSRGIRNRSTSTQVAQTKSTARIDMNCCADCIQMACVGNCPSKKLTSGVCFYCLENNCKGNCQNTVYESRTRAERSNFDEDIKTTPQRLRACPSCQKKQNAKDTNVNNRVMGRPRSGFCTFRTHSSRSKDVKPKSILCNNNFELEEEFTKLGIVSDQTYDDLDRPHTTGTVRRLKGRAAVIPGKSFFSQRRDSLTDISKEDRVRLAVIATRKRLRSSKKKRPKTAM